MQQTQPEVRGFQGENRLLADNVLPDNVSPDAQNCDYSLGTIQKRKGYTKVVNSAVKSGGVRINNSSDNACIQIPNHSDYDFSGAFTVEVFFEASRIDAAGPIITNRDTGSTAGWEISVTTTGGLACTIYDSGGTERTIAAVAGDFELGERVHAVFARDASDNLEKYVNATNTTGGTASGITASGRDIWIGADEGATPGNTDLDVVVDEVRIWSDERTAAELTATRNRELSAVELADSNLKGYWRLNDGRFSIVEDLSTNNNHGAFYQGETGFVDGLVTNESGDGTAIRFDGIYNHAKADWGTSNNPLEEIFVSGSAWTIEGWCRLDKPLDASTDYWLLQLVGVAGGDIGVYIEDSTAGGQLRAVYSTRTTHTDAELESTLVPTVGTAFHFAIVRNSDSLTIYINGAQDATTTGVTTELGPETALAAGNDLYFGCKDGSTNFAPVTLDEVRFWNVARSETEIANWQSREYPDAISGSLILYYRMNVGFVNTSSGGGLKALVTGGADLSLRAAGADQPSWCRGLVYPVTPPRITMAAPMFHQAADDSERDGVLPFRREVMLSTQSDYWSLIGTDVDWVSSHNLAGAERLFDTCHFQNKLIFCNGVEDNKKYTGSGAPTALTIAQATAPSSVNPTGAGSGWGGAAGDYGYRIAYYNSNDSTESLADAGTTWNAVTVAASNDTVDISSFPTPPDEQITHYRIYRRDPGSSTYRYLADHAIDGGTYSDTGTSITANDAINENRGHPVSAYWCEVYANRLWLAKGSTLYYSEADTIDFPASNQLFVDRGDGDEITGLKSAFGGLLVFKKRSIHYLSGYGATTFQLRKVVQGQGCVSGHTIAESSAGVYYLSYDGVYLLGSGMVPNNVGLSQQATFELLDEDNYHFNCGAYHDPDNRYIVSIYTNDAGTTDRKTLVFDEESTSWAEWDCYFDVLVSGETDNPQPYLFGARDGFLFRLLNGDSDGSGTSSYTGSCGSLNGDTFTDGGASFPTTGDGLKGCTVVITDSDGTTTYDRTIVDNDSDTLWLDSSVTLSGSGTYAVGPIRWRWRSRFMDMGDMSRVKRFYTTNVWQVEKDGDTVTVKHRTEGNETWVSATFTTTDEFNRFLTPNRGRRFQLEFSNINDNQPVHIEGFQTSFTARRFV